MRLFRFPLDASHFPRLVARWRSLRRGECLAAWSGGIAVYRRGRKVEQVPL